MPTPDGWKDKSKCKDLDPYKADQLFFPEGNKANLFAAARAYCETCPVRMTCATYAIVLGINWGAWGGMSPNERRQWARGRRQEIRQLWNTFYPESISA